MSEPKTTTRPLRILAIGYATSNHVVTRVQAFVPRGHDVYLLSTPPGNLTTVKELTPTARPGRDEWVASAARVVGRLVKKDLSGLADMVRLFLDFRRLLKNTNPDVVHVHYAYSTWAWLAGAIGARPLMVSVMGGDVLFEEQGQPTPRGIALTKRLFAAADKITAKSDYLITMLDNLGGYGGKAERVVWGIDPEQFKPRSGVAFKAELGIPPDAQIVLSPKILQPFYNIDVIVEAMGKVVRNNPRAHLVVTEYGADPDYRAALKARISALGFEKNVTFVGHISYERMPMFYAIADVAIGIPKSDGLPQTLLEAMACGVPNIVGRLDRYGEIVKDGESVVFADVTSESVAQAIERILSDTALRQRIATRGREIVLEIANFPNDVQRVETMYRELASRPRRTWIVRPLMVIDVARYWLRV